MADDSNQLVIQVLTDTKKAVTDLGDLAKKAESSFAALGASVEIVALNQAIELGGKVVGAIVGATKEITNFVLAGEQVRVVNQQFQLLSEQSGVASESIRAGLESAAGGLATDTDLIKSANKAMIELGKSSEKIPEILEVARKTISAGFGNDLIANFEQINQAIANGQTRQLRSLGIIIDSDKAIKNFAKSIGVSVDSLSQAGRQQAILNAVLEKGQTAFAGIDPNIAQGANSLQRLKVAINDLKEGFEIVADKILNGPLSKVFQGLAALADATSTSLKATFGTGATQADAERKQVNQALDEILIRLSQFKDVVGQEGISSVLEQQASALRGQLELIDEGMRKSAAQAHQVNEAISADAANARFVDPEKALADQAKLASILARNSQIIAETAALDIEGRSQQEIENEQFNLKSQQLNADFESQRASIVAQARNASLADQSAYNDQILFLELQKNEKLNQLRRTSDVVGSALAKNFQTSVAQGISGGIQKIVGALISGKNAFADFGKFILGLIGDFAIQVGTTIIAAGIAYRSLGDFSGTSPLIFGAALVALGTILKTFAGSGGSDVGAGSGGSGGGSLSGSPEITNPTIQRANPGTNVQVVVQGNVFDNRQTGLAIVDILQEHFNNNGSILAGA